MTFLFLPDEIKRTDLACFFNPAINGKFNGQVADFNLWLNRVLTPEEMQAMAHWVIKILVIGVGLTWPKVTQSYGC